ncbi:MAG: hypothetical protein R3F59_16220 [Myxococcota bacterium]
MEILSAVRERAPGLPEVDAAEMARLQTLGQVVDHLRSALPSGAPAAAAAAPAPKPAAAAIRGGRGGAAARRGRREDRLPRRHARHAHGASRATSASTPSSASEILSAVRERAPGLPEVDAAEMARLQTLGQVVDHLRAALPAGGAAAPAAPAAPKPASGASAVDVEALLLDVVAEKTGYPADMLGMHMALERPRRRLHQARGDPLRRPRARAGPPEVDAAEMARLQTLGQVVDHLRAALPGGGAAAAPAAPAAAPSAVDVEALLLDVVAETATPPTCSACT